MGMRADAGRAVMGFAYIVLARLLLVVHDPTVPTLGPQRRRAIAEIDVSVPFFSRCGYGLGWASRF